MNGSIKRTQKPSTLILPCEEWYNEQHLLIGPQPNTQLLGHEDPHIPPCEAKPTTLKRPSPSEGVRITCLLSTIVEA